MLEKFQRKARIQETRNLIYLLGIKYRKQNNCMIFLKFNVKSHLEYRNQNNIKLYLKFSVK